MPKRDHPVNLLTQLTCLSNPFGETLQELYQTKRRKLLNRNIIMMVDSSSTS